MSLYRLNSWLTARLNKYAARAAFLQSQIGRIPSWQHRYLTESLISDIWLSWCWFSRTLIHKSLRGTKAGDSAVIPGRSGDNSWQTIGHQCKRVLNSQNHNVSAPPGFAMRFEPTWGDITCLIKIVTTLTPSNSEQLLTALGLPLKGPQHVQLVRNCLAHKNIESLFNIRAEFAVTYAVPRTFTPTDIAWTNLRGSADLAIDLWIEDMRVIGDYATKTA